MYIIFLLLFFKFIKINYINSFLNKLNQLKKKILNRIFQAVVNGNVKNGGHYIPLV